MASQTPFKRGFAEMSGKGIKLDRGNLMSTFRVNTIKGSGQSRAIAENVSRAPGWAFGGRVRKRG